MAPVGGQDGHRLHGCRWMKKRCVQRISISRATWDEGSKGVDGGGGDESLDRDWEVWDFLARALSIEKEGRHRWRYKRQQIGGASASATAHA